MDPRYLVRGELPAWVVLPGDLELRHTWRSWLCPKHGPQPVPTRDRRAGCAECHPSWTGRAASRAVDVFKRARKAGVRGRLFTFNLRPPWGAIPPTEAALDAFLVDAQLVLRAHGLAGGCIMAHAVGKEAPGLWAPHAHGPGPLEGHRYTPGPVVDPDNLEDPRTREVQGRLEGLEPSRQRRVLAALRRWKGSYLHFEKVRGRGLWRQLRAVLTYELGHAIRREGRDALRWFGALASNGAARGTWEKPALADPGAPPCPVCGEPMEPLDLVDSTAWPAARVPRWDLWDPGGWSLG